MSSREQTREWVDAILQNLQISPTELARRAGVAATTLTRFMNDPAYPNDLSRRTIEAVSQIAGVKPMQKPGDRVRGLASNGEAERYSFGSDETIDRLVREYSLQNTSEIWILKSRSLEHEGFVPGDTLVIDTKEMAVPGDIVCAEINDWKANRTETIFRVYEPPFIVAASSDRVLRRPLAVDQDTVKIKGIVIASLRPRRHFAA